MERDLNNRALFFRRYDRDKRPSLMTLRPATNHPELSTDTVSFEIVPGRGAASGQREYQQISGSIRAQKPHFLRKGLDLSDYYDGTINARLDVAAFRILKPYIRILNVGWLPGFPPENFDFCQCIINLNNETVGGLVYYPRPETKSAYASMPPPNVIELLAPFIPGTQYGMRGRLTVSADQIAFIA